MLLVSDIKLGKASTHSNGHAKGLNKNFTYGIRICDLFPCRFSKDRACGFIIEELLLRSLGNGRNRQAI